MSEIYVLIVHHCSLVVGTVGLIIILLGALRATFMYMGRLFQGVDRQFADIRLVLGSHIVLGLDFLVGQDIISTFLLERNEPFWPDLAELVIVVTIRIVLTHFMIKEMNELAREE